MNFISISHSKSNRLDAVKEIKNMVLFTEIVLSPLILGAMYEKNENTERTELTSEASNSNIQTEVTSVEPEATTGNDQNYDLIGEPQLESSLVSSSNSISQKSEKKHHVQYVSVDKDLDLATRRHIYEDFLLYCRSGDVVQLGLGSTLSLELDHREFAKLATLQNILGLSDVDVSIAHQNIGEQAFRTEVEKMRLDSNVSNFLIEKKIYLLDIQKKFGLMIHRARKIIQKVKRIQFSNIGSEISFNERKDTMSLESLMNLSKPGVKLENLISKNSRLKAYCDEVEKVMTNGEGNFDKTKFLEEYPKTLSLDCDETTKIVKDIAKRKLRPTLVQAISFHRQNKGSEVVKTMKNYLSQLRACYEPVAWNCKEDMVGVYMHCIAEIESKELREEIAKGLNLAHSTVEAIEATTKIEKKTQDEEDMSYFG
eukprot:gnl/TRDRNA2_/TRDRNA2_177602_c0_seq1.p2 gnl/TRDRNA2_/TRDRNA2_177602_c0~~gnl/TRDRNA2_/TRDRNA2_177602_c0_seq1.p2  ORF type:complete len:426 (+),score=1.15 gnl/TRDRNA2_/TRDRNA2_177602_c0_seq1:1679-2956(+)